MPSFKFKQFTDLSAKGGIDFSTQTFYIALVTAVPAFDITTRSGLTEASGGTYAPVVLSNPTFTYTNPTVNADLKVSFNDFTFINLSTTSGVPIVGGVVCRRVGGSFATSDPVLLYQEFTSPYTPSGVSLQVNFNATTGMIQYT